MIVLFLIRILVAVKSSLLAIKSVNLKWLYTFGLHRSFLDRVSILFYYDFKKIKKKNQTNVFFIPNNFPTIMSKTLD